MDEQLDEHGARLKHVESFPGYRVPRTNFDRALHALANIPFHLSRDGRRAAMLAALDYGASWGQIKHWRAGRRHVPQWVKDMLARKLAARRMADEQAESDIRAA